MTRDEKKLFLQRQMCKIDFNRQKLILVLYLMSTFSWHVWTAGNLAVIDMFREIVRGSLIWGLETSENQRENAWWQVCLFLAMNDKVKTWDQIAIGVVACNVDTRLTAGRNRLITPEKCMDVKVDKGANIANGG